MTLLPSSKQLFVFYQIIILIICIRPNSKDPLLGTALICTLHTAQWANVSLTPTSSQTPLPSHQGHQDPQLTLC